MRALLLAAALLLALAPALAAPAAACHPALLVEERAEYSGVRLVLDMGCDHEVPPRWCVQAWTWFMGFTGGAC